MYLHNLQRVADLKRHLKETNERIAVCENWLKDDGNHGDPVLGIGNVAVMFNKAVSEADIFVELVQAALSSLQAEREDVEHSLVQLGVELHDSHHFITFTLEVSSVDGAAHNAVKHNATISRVRFGEGGSWLVDFTTKTGTAARELAAKILGCTDAEIENHTDALEGFK